MKDKGAELEKMEYHSDHSSNLILGRKGGRMIAKEEGQVAV